MKNVIIFIIVFVLSWFFGWFVGVGQREGISNPSLPDTIVVTDTIYVDTLKAPGTIIIEKQATFNVDSLYTVLDYYYAVVDSLFEKVNFIARMDSTTDKFSLSASYNIPRNSFNIGLTLYKQTEYITKPVYVTQQYKWWEHFSLYMSTDMDVGIGYSAISITRNLNDGVFKFNFNPRISDIRSWIKRR